MTPTEPEDRENFDVKDDAQDIVDEVQDVVDEVKETGEEVSDVVDEGVAAAQARLTEAREKTASERGAAPRPPTQERTPEENP